MRRCDAKLMFGISLSPRLAERFDEELEIAALAAGVSSQWINRGALAFRGRLKMPNLMLLGYSEEDYAEANVEWFEEGHCFVDEYFLGFELAQGPVHEMREQLKNKGSVDEFEKAWAAKISPVLAAMDWDHWGPGLQVIELGSR